MSKKYAVIDSYGKLLVPVSMLEKITEHCLIGRTEWLNSKDVLIEVETINKVQIIDQGDIDNAKAQMALSGD